MKKIVLVFGSLLALLLVAIVVIPLVVDVDKYRPQAVAAVNDKINGRFSLGHLKLSLWGQVRVEADGLELKDAQGESIVSVKDAYFHLPLLSLLSGSPEIDLRMDNPTVNVLKNRAGKLNVLTLIKTQAVASSAAAKAAPSVSGASGTSGVATESKAAPTQAAASSSAPGSAPESAQIAVPAIAANARLGFDLKNAQLHYKDESNAMVTDLKDLNIVAKNLSLSHPSELSIWSDFDTQMGTKEEEGMSVHGPGRIDFKFLPEVSGGKLSNFTIEGDVNFDELAILLPGKFEKKKGVPANIAFAVSGSMQAVKIEKADAHFFNAEIRSHGTATDLQTAPVIQYALTSNSIELKPWVELLPALKQFELGGEASLSAEVNGKTDKLAYTAKLALRGLTARAPGLKAQPRIDGEIDVATNQIQNMTLTLKAPGNSLKIQGKVLGFASPQISFDVTSSEMNLDQLLEFKPAQKTVLNSGQNLGWIASAFAEADPAKAAPADFDAMLDPLRVSKPLQSATANIAFDFKSLQAQGTKISDLSGKLYLKNLAAGLDNFSMKVFNGTIKASLSAQLKPRAPTYKLQTHVSGLDLGEAVKSQLAAFKNTVTGKADFELTGEGTSFNAEAAKQNLKAKGSMKITNAVFTTIDVGKMAADALGSSIQKISSKVPALNGKNAGGGSQASKYSLISSSFGITGGKFSAPDFVARAAPNQGIDLKGNTAIGLKDMSLKADWEVTDTYNMTHAKDISPSINGTTVPHILAEGNKPVTFPVSVGCTLKAPCYDYDQAIGYLGKVAMGNLASAMTGQAKDAAVQQIQKAVGGSLPPAIANKLKGLFGH